MQHKYSLSLWGPREARRTQVNAFGYLLTRGQSASLYGLLDASGCLSDRKGVRAFHALPSLHFPARINRYRISHISQVYRMLEFRRCDAGCWMMARGWAPGRAKKNPRRGLPDADEAACSALGAECPACRAMPRNRA